MTLKSLFITTLLIVLVACTPSEVEVEVTREVVVTKEVTRVVEAPSYVPDSFYDAHIVETMYSDTIDETFRLYVALPPSYETSTAERYPVLYVTDGNVDSHLANIFAWNLNWINVAPEIIVVGIGYDTNVDDEMLHNRGRDLLPQGSGSSPGRAHQFLEFVMEEVVPHIDSTFRTQPERRFLAGFSAGGAFALYTLFNAPGQFEGIIATSPVITFRGWSAITEAETFATSGSDLPTKLFVSWGSLEESFQQERFVERLRELGIGGLEIDSAEFAGENHVTAWVVGMQRGMREVFDPRFAK